MCGILGVRRTWCTDEARVRRALASLVWRGPDGSRLERVGGWWLGVARLAISDPDAPQPLREAHSGRRVAFNGAVTSAGREWAQYGGLARTRNDAELALRRLAEGGASALAATCGPYALAIVDPDDDALWLARDPEGEKPLFVALAEGRPVAFASTAAALRVLGLDVRLSELDRARLLRYGFAAPPGLESGSVDVRGDLHGVWHACGEERLREVPGSPPPEATSDATLRHRVEAAAERCATADVRVALALSGGVDSACLAAALQRRGHRVPAYQVKTLGSANDERERAGMVAAATGLELRPIDVGPEVLDALPALTRATGAPQGDPSVLLALALARRAHRDGVRVLLSGEGADDVFLGYRRHRAAARLPSRGWRWLPAPARGRGTFARTLRAAQARVPYDSLLEVTTPAFRAQVWRIDRALGDLPGAGDREPSLARARRIDRTCYLRWDLLPKADTASLAAGVESRCPFLDPEVLAAPEARQRDARDVLGKRALKHAFEDVLPAAVVRGRKIGFGLPLDRWLREHDGIADVVRQAVRNGRPWLDPAGLTRALDRHRRGDDDVGHGLYLVAALELYERVLEETPCT